MACIFFVYQKAMGGHKCFALLTKPIKTRKSHSFNWLFLVFFKREALRITYNTSTSLLHISLVLVGYWSQYKHASHDDYHACNGHPLAKTVKCCISCSTSFVLKKGGTVRCLSNLWHRQVAIHETSTNSPRLSARAFCLLVLFVSKFWRFRDLRTRAKAQYLMYKYRTETLVNDLLVN